jgi:acyl-[acyl-carrier-protein]-phospholipid O-acyltransferase/long-chain-fatty-acid--[acyl-carrier-protein] ligase
MSPAEVHRRLLETDIPRLWIPSADDFIKVEQIPILGTGKTDLKRLKDLAAESVGG